jgi:hypothetical protein
MYYCNKISSNETDTRGARNKGRVDSFDCETSGSDLKIMGLCWSDIKISWTGTDSLDYVSLLLMRLTSRNGGNYGTRTKINLFS